MKIDDLVRALLNDGPVEARQWIADARRTGFDYSSVPRPRDSSALELALAAGVVELLAERANQRPPAWTAAVEPAPEKVFLLRSAERMPRLRRLCEEEGPEPLRRRGLLAPPDFLMVA